jgi:16S rRNA (cytidine1402-2'-O)-methyltransferase
MSATLFLVATPIGNLEDITLRALRILREADLIAAEDTRRTGILLAHHGISTRTISFHEHNTRSRVPQLAARLRAGENIALVTDAGTPAISDPGMELVAECVRQGIAVDPIPGANAHITAAVASGFPLDPVTIFGFSPKRSGPKEGWLEHLAAIPHTVVFLEAPHRMLDTLRRAVVVLGERPIVVGRELTKAHQEFLRGTADEILQALREPKGEFTVVVGPAPTRAAEFESLSDDHIAAIFCDVTNNSGTSRREGISLVSTKLGLSKKQVYAAIERAKK